MPQRPCRNVAIADMLTLGCQNVFCDGRPATKHRVVISQIQGLHHVSREGKRPAKSGRRADKRVEPRRSDVSTGEVRKCSLWVVSESIYVGFGKLLTDVLRDPFASGHAKQLIENDRHPHSNRSELR